jgi:hypothetical protein
MKTTDEWAQKRKTLSVAFYKDKFTLICENIKNKAEAMANEWKA